MASFLFLTFPSEVIGVAVGAAGTELCQVCGVSLRLLARLNYKPGARRLRRREPLTGGSCLLHPGNCRILFSELASHSAALIIYTCLYLNLSLVSLQTL